MAIVSRTVPISKLVLDQSNARLGDIQPDQQTTAAALAKQLGPQLAELAKHILQHGLDPTALLAITPEGAPAGKYRVIEGNRRTLTLKALHDPSIVQSAGLSPVTMNKLAGLAAEFADSPINEIDCTVFDRESEAATWITLRHTGANGGVGLVSWNSNEIDRYRSRHLEDNLRNPGGQVIDFVDSFVPPDPLAKNRIITTVLRLVLDPDVRQRLGINIVDKVVYSYYPASEVLKGLFAVVDDLRSERIKVTDVYLKEPRIEYINNIEADRLPNRSTRFEPPVPLSALTSTVNQDPSTADTSSKEDSTLTNSDSGTVDYRRQSTEQADAHKPYDTRSNGAPNNQAGAKKSRAKPERQRPTVIPSNCNLWITAGRINSIYRELQKLEVEKFPNAASVLIRVFLELTVDDRLKNYSLLPEIVVLNTPLAKKLRTLADHLFKTSAISEQIKRTVHKVADGASVSASIVTLHQYVHNEFTYPSASEVRRSWDEIEPFMTAMWEK